jgi:DNA mismatch repair protein MutS
LAKIQREINSAIVEHTCLFLYVKSAAETPLMRQYNQIKERHPDTVLLFRLGDFYETFGDDAVIAARSCGITLTKRNNGSAGEMPLAGFPHHQLDNYLPKLVAAGYRVAVCEQLEDPKTAKGIVKRDVVEVVTPGVVLYDKLLDSRRNTYVACIAAPEREGGYWGVAVADISTGSFTAGDVPSDAVESIIESFAPAEIIVNKEQRSVWEPIVQRCTSRPAVSRLEAWHFHESTCEDQLRRHFATASLKGFGIDDAPMGIVAAGVIIHYVAESQKSALSQLQSIRRLRHDDVMILDASTRRNLEIQSPSGMYAASGALVDLLDQTSTPMGARLLRWWMLTPLKDLQRIQQRHAVVRLLVDHAQMREQLRMVASRFGDLERQLTKIVTNRATARDVGSFRNGLRVIPDLLQACNEAASPELGKIVSSISKHEELASTVDRALADEPPALIGTGTMFRSGYNDKLDAASQALLHGREWINAYQQRQRDETGIPNLKIGHTGVFGYYIEVSNAQQSKVPASYDRRQTLANAERYTTQELKELEQQIRTAQDSVSHLETMLLQELRETITAECQMLQRTLQHIAILDVLTSFAHVASLHGYVEPELHTGTELEIINARHPVIEQLLGPGASYVPNTIQIDTSASQVHIITGPNMSGKSSYLRQVGICVYLSHIGCFVPATSARVPLTDRIFTRVGAQDNILAGESTFLVEMQESANILNNATDRSLILLDEVGRGTATFDGISIAWAIAEHIHDRIGAKTIFATHYHELTELATSLARVVNFQVEVQEVENDIVFTHRVIPGHSNHSFGIHVAKMAGMPPVVVATARAVLQTMESTHSEAVVPANTGLRAAQVSLFELRDDHLRSIIAQIDINNMTPLQALQTLMDLRKTINE